MESEKAPFAFESPPHVMIIAAQGRDASAAAREQSALAVLDAVKATHEMIAVPGAADIPAALAFALKALEFDPLRRRPDGYIALGCALDNGAAADVTRVLQGLAVSHALAIGNDITAGDKAQEKGREAAATCLRMIELKHHFRLSPKRRWVAK